MPIHGHKQAGSEAQAAKSAQKPCGNNNLCETCLSWRPRQAIALTGTHEDPPQPIVFSSHARTWSLLFVACLQLLCAEQHLFTVCVVELGKTCYHRQPIKFSCLQFPPAWSTCVRCMPTRGKKLRSMVDGNAGDRALTVRRPSQSCV